MFFTVFVYCGVRPMIVQCQRCGERKDCEIMRDKNDPTGTRNVTLCPECREILEEQARQVKGIMSWPKAG